MMPRSPLRVLLLLALLAPPAPAGAQEPASLSGLVSDPAGDPVGGAVLTLLPDGGGAQARSALTDARGAYQLVGLRPGAYTLRVDRLGYGAAGEERLTLAAGERRRLDLVLQVETVELEGVVVRGRRAADRERDLFETDPGITARVVSGEALKRLPGLAEADVLRAVELLPGVISTSDFSSAFNVRGGSADQNLILLDGFPIFNPFHLGGLFGVFNADAIERAELLAGGFGAEYGGRVSSVLNVESRVEGGQGLEVAGGVSLLASRVLVRAPLEAESLRRVGVERGSWLVSARRSYFDALLAPFFDFPYHLTDLQAHAALELAGGGRLSFTGYAGEDVIDFTEFQEPGADPDSASVLRFRRDWGNRVAGLRWEQPVSGRWRADTRLGHTAFREDLGFVDFDDIRLGRGIRQLMLHSDWVGQLAPTTALRLGAGLDWLDFEHSVHGGGRAFVENRGDGVLGSVYGSLRWEPGGRLLVEPGLRLDQWRADGATETIPSPRVAAKLFLDEGRTTAVKLALGRYSQFLHSLRNEELPISNDNWVLMGSGVPPVVSDQVQAGIESFWDDAWSASAEAYYRTFDGVTELNVADDPNDPTDDLLSGEGESYGLDFLVRRTAGRLTGWASLSFLRAERTLPDPRLRGWADVAPEVTFPPTWDRRMDVDLVAQYRLPRNVELGARWNYGSALPYTRPTAQYFAWRHDPLTGQYEPASDPQEDGEGDDDGPPLYLVLGPRNQERYPPYHRLDLTVRRTFRPAWGSWTPYLQVLNVYNRRNVLFYFYNYDRLPATRSGISMFPVLPTVGVEVSF